MPDIRERFGAFDRLDMPDLWHDAQHREPRPAKGTDHERARKAIVIVTALVLTVATTGVMIRAFSHGDGAEPVTGSPAVWPTGTVKDLKLSFRYPPQWRLQPFAEEIGTIYFQGVLISNTDLTFHHPKPSDGGETSAWDLSDLPADGVVISIEQISGGPPPGPEKGPVDTALPLSLSDAKVLAPQPDPLGFSPKPAGTEERYLEFVLKGQRDGVRVFFAPGASHEAKAAAAEVVASIGVRAGSPSETCNAIGHGLGRPTVQVPDLIGMTLRHARHVLQAECLPGGVSRQASSAPAWMVIRQSPGAGSLYQPGWTVILTVSIGHQNGT